MGNILIDIGHPADVHHFRVVAQRWEAAGHRTLFTVLDREVIVHLVKHYGLNYKLTYKRQPGRWRLLHELPVRIGSTWQAARQFKADLFMSFGSPTCAIPAWLMGKPYVGMTDTEHATEQHALFKPFSTLILTPDVFGRDMGPNQIRYRGYHELMYLHPTVFTPDPREIESLGLRPDEPYFVLRFVSWGATHDIGQHGFSGAEKRELVRALAQRGRVLLSVEDGIIEPEFAPYVTTFPPENVHHLLAFASLYIGEGGTMASEAAVLGTPSIYMNTLRMGYIDDEQAHGLLFMPENGREALAQALELLDVPDLKATFQERRARLLAKKTDTVDWLENLAYRLLENPHYRPESAPRA
jgi:predicted glycosyltransferase